MSRLLNLLLPRSFWGRYAVFSAGFCLVPTAGLYYSTKTEGSEEELHRTLEVQYATKVRSAREKNAKIRELWAAQQAGDPEVLAKYDQVLRGGKTAGSAYSADHSNRAQIESGRYPKVAAAQPKAAP